MTFRKVFSCLCLNSNPRNTIRRNISERFLITVALCATKSGVSSITRLFVHWYVHDSTDELHWMRFRSPCCHGFILFERFSPSSVSRSCQCRASVVLDSLLSHPQARLDRCCRHRRSDRLLLRRSDVSEVRLVLTSRVLHGGMRDLVLHCLAVKLLIWTVVAAAAPGCFCRVLIVALILTCFHPLWVPLFPPVVVPLFSPAVGPLFSFLLHSGARRSCWDFSLFSSVCRAVHDVLSGGLFACVQHAQSRAARGLLD